MISRLKSISAASCGAPFLKLSHAAIRLAAIELARPRPVVYKNYMGSNTSREDDTRAVLDAVRRIVHALRESSRWAEKHVGLSGAQLFVLQKLAESPDAVSVNELAARTHTHQSSVSTVVARLVGRGLVRRVWSEADGRSVELTLSRRGQQVTG